MDTFIQVQLGVEKKNKTAIYLSVFLDRKHSVNIYQLHDVFVCGVEGEGLKEVITKVSNIKDSIRNPVSGTDRSLTGNASLC